MSSKPRKRGVQCKKAGRVAMRRHEGCKPCRGCVPHAPGQAVTARFWPPQNRIWAMDLRCTEAQERTRGKAERLLCAFSKHTLTDGNRFRHRIDSRSQMSRSGNYRAVLGTSWRSWRGRWSVLLPSWIFGRVTKSVGGVRRGRDADGG